MLKVLTYFLLELQWNRPALESEKEGHWPHPTKGWCFVHDLKFTAGCSSKCSQTKVNTFFCWLSIQLITQLHSFGQPLKRWKISVFGVVVFRCQNSSIKRNVVISQVFFLFSFIWNIYYVCSVVISFQFTCLCWLGCYNFIVIVQYEHVWFHDIYDHFSFAAVPFSFS